MFALRAAQPGTLSPLSLARARASNQPPSARSVARMRSRARPRRGRRSARHGGEDGGGGCPRQKGESGQWLVGKAAVPARSRCEPQLYYDFGRYGIFISFSTSSGRGGSYRREMQEDLREGCRLKTGDKGRPALYARPQETTVRPHQGRLNSPH